MNNRILENLENPEKNETLEYWIYKNRKEIFRLHLERSDINWKKISQEVSEIFNLPTILRTSEFIHLLNSDFLFGINSRLTYSR